MERSRMGPVPLEIADQLRTQFTFPGRCRLVEMVEPAQPLAAPHQGSRVAEQQQSIAGASECQCQCLRAVSESDGSVRVAAREAHQHHRTFALAECGWDTDLQGEGSAGQTGCLRELSD